MKKPFPNHVKNQFLDQLVYEGFALPETIRQCVEETIVANTFTCLDPLKAKGHCLRMSHLLMLNLAEEGKRPFVDCKIIHTKKPYPHFWIYVDGWHIDLTAKQFSPDQPCPKIWKDEDCNLTSLYTVERGKYTVLFKLVPFKDSSVSVYSIVVINRIVKQALKKRYNDLKSIIVDFINNRIKQENSIFS
jgi:hypothetical protein